MFPSTFRNDYRISILGWLNWLSSICVIINPPTKCTTPLKFKSKSNTPKISPLGGVWRGLMQQKKFRKTFCCSPYNPSWKKKIQICIFQLSRFRINKKTTGIIMKQRECFHSKIMSIPNVSPVFMGYYLHSNLIYFDFRESNWPFWNKSNVDCVSPSICIPPPPAFFMGV